MAKIDTYLQHETLFRGDLEARKNLKVLLCGGGALGSFLADLLARQGYRLLAVLDREKVDDTNFGTQNFGLQDVGRAKATQIMANIFRRIGVKIIPIVKELKPSNARVLLRGYDLVVDLFDNGESRELIRATCEKEGTACVHAGVAAMGYLQVRWNEQYTTPKTQVDADTEAPCEYPMASNLVMACVALTAEVINRFVDQEDKRNVEFWLNSMSLEIE